MIYYSVQVPLNALRIHKTIYTRLVFRMMAKLTMIVDSKRKQFLAANRHNISL